MGSIPVGLTTAVRYSPTNPAPWPSTAGFSTDIHSRLVHYRSVSSRLIPLSYGNMTATVP